MKLSTQGKYFINGVMLICLALLSVTIIPMCAKLNFEKYIYVQAEFFFLCCASIFYLFSPKFYKYQITSIVIALFLYFLFVKLYS